jgi:hydroxyquinol 1,2-dioxygenase
MSPVRLLSQVQDAYAGIENIRARELVDSAIRHLHAFAADVKLTRSEWKEGIEFLTSTGQACSETRQEFVLLSDLLGVSTLVERMDYEPETRQTPSSVEGPFFVAGSPRVEFGGSIIIGDGQGGERVLVRGRVIDGAGAPVAGAQMDIWQTAPNQKYAVQDDNQDEFNLRGIAETDADGRYSFITLTPVPYSVPTDGPCGALLRASGRHGMRAAHIHIRLQAEGFQTLVTQIFPASDPYLESDTVFGVDPALLVDFEPVPASDDGYAAMAQFDFVMKRPSDARRS